MRYVYQNSNSWYIVCKLFEDYCVKHGGCENCLINDAKDGEIVASVDLCSKNRKVIDRKILLFKEEEYV